MKSLLKLATDRKGQVLIWGALTIPAIAVVLGLSLDVGLIYDVRRRMQTAADGAARSGAAELARAQNALAVDAARQDAARAGFDDGHADVTVTATLPPDTGPRSGDPNFIQVVISEEVDTYFMKLLNRHTVTVRARAVAGILPTGDACIMALNRTVRSGIFVNGTPLIDANCGIMSNSADSGGLNVPGTSIVNASWVGVTGGHIGGGTVTPTPRTGVPPMVNPLAHMAPLNAALFPSGSRSGDTYFPGVFGGRVTIANGTATFESGVYIFEGGLRVNGGTVTGNGVTFYFPSGANIDIGGNSDVTLTAPAGGPTQGMLIMGHPAVGGHQDIGMGTGSFAWSGSIYMPGADIRLAGTPLGGGTNGVIIGDTVTISGTSTLTLTNPDPDNGGVSLMKITLVE